MHKDPLERERQFRQMVENSAAAQRIAQSPRLRFLWWLRSLAAPFTKRLWLAILLTALLAFGGLFLLIFGVAVKWTDAYACSLAEAQRSPAVVSALGEPVSTGFFAWLYRYSRQGSVTDVSFRTALVGPKGEGTLRVQWYSSPVGSRLQMELEKDGLTHLVYDEAIPCR